MNTDYPKVGAVWPHKSIEGGLSIKLSNGVYITLLPNKFKDEGENRPHYNATIAKADAILMGLPIDEQNNQSNQSPF